MSDKITEQAKRIIVEKIREAHERVYRDLEPEDLEGMWEGLSRQDLVKLSHGMHIHLEAEIGPPPHPGFRERIAGVQADYTFYDEELRSIVPEDPMQMLTREQMDRYLNDALVSVNPPDPMDYVDKGIIMLPDAPPKKQRGDVPPVTCLKCGEVIDTYIGEDKIPYHGSCLPPWIKKGDGHD